METLTISLSKAHREFIEAQMAEEGFRSVNKYFDALLRAERKRRAEKRLVQLVKEAEESGPATPMSPKEWDDIREEVAAGIARRRKGRKPTP